MTKQDRDKLLEKIAKKTLGIATLETRKGGVDFYEGNGGCVAVWNLKKAFQKAFDAGRKSILKSTDIKTAKQK